MGGMHPLPKLWIKLLALGRREDLDADGPGGENRRIVSRKGTTHRNHAMHLAEVAALEKPEASGIRAVSPCLDRFGALALSRHEDGVEQRGTEAVAALLGMDDEIQPELVAPHFPCGSVGHQGLVGHDPFPSKIAEPAFGTICILALPQR
jgi:hypothetical protein